MFRNSNNQREISKWIIGTFTCCILIYLGIRHINIVAEAISFLVSLFNPLLIGAIMALVLNVPMSNIELLLSKRITSKSLRRSLSILFSFVLVIGIFVGIAFLVIPELLDAVQIVVQIVNGGLDQLATMDTKLALMESSAGKYLAEINIDWNQLQTQLNDFIKKTSDSIVRNAMDATSSFASKFVSFFIGLVFSVHILFSKEKLSRQVCRLIHVWLPEKFGNIFLHVCNVCSNTFRLFIAGQTTEAIILGTLCMIGMAILRIPYAPMIGALIGVTAFIPIIGAYVGAVIGALMILTVNPFKALVFLIFLVILQQVEGNMIYPKVVGSKINLPAIWVLAAVTIGGNLGGPLGMLLGVPAASACYALFKEATLLRENKISQ